MTFATKHIYCIVCLGSDLLYFTRGGGVKVGVPQGSVLIHMRFIIVLEALARLFHAVVPWKDVYADDLVIIADSLEKCVSRLLIWKEAIEKKGLE